MFETCILHHNWSTVLHPHQISAHCSVCTDDAAGRGAWFGCWKTGQCRFGAGELWSCREQSFCQSCAFFQSTENKSYHLSRHAICLSTGLEKLWGWLSPRNVGYSNWWEETFKRFFASQLQLKILWMVFLAAVSKVEPRSVRCSFLAVTWRDEKVFSHLESLGLSDC